MNFARRLKIISYSLLGVILSMIPVLVWSFAQTDAARDDDSLADKIQVKVYERIALRDEYILYQEERSKAQWLAIAGKTDLLLQKAAGHLTDRKERLVLAEMRKNFDETVAIFGRILSSAEKAKKAGAKKNFHDSELGKRLYSQQVQRASTLQEATSRLQKLTASRVDRANRRTIVITAFFVFAVALTAALNALFLTRSMRRRLITLHAGAREISDGNLDFRISCSGSDEFADLASTINVMTEKVQGYTRELQKSHDLLDALSSQVPGALFQAELSGDGNFTVPYISAAIHDIYELSPGDVLEGAAPIFERIHPDDRDAVIASLLESSRTLTPWQHEYRVVLPQQGLRWCDGIARPRQLEDGGFVWYGFISDGTGHKMAQKSLVDSEEKYRTIFELESDAMFLVDCQSLRFIDANAAASTMYGYSREELLQLKALDLSAEKVDTERALSTNETHVPLRWHRKKDGSVFLVEIAGSYFTYHGRNTHVAAIRNVGERLLAEEKLLESNRRFSTVFYSSPIAIGISSHGSGFYIDINEAFVDLLGYSREEVLGRTSLELGLWPRPEERARLLAEMAAHGRVQQFEAVFRHKSGRIGDLLISAEIIELSGKSHVIGMFSDITERKKAENAQKATVELLRLCNEADSLPGLMRDLTLFFQQFTGCEAVGVRLGEGEDFPYYESQGFTAEFVRDEKSLCTHGSCGEVERGVTGSAVLECLCGLVLGGCLDCSLPGCTPHGSFWANSTQQFQSQINAVAGQARIRNRCHEEGYQSIVLIPLRTKNQIFGMFQFNDRRTGQFSAESIGALENMVSYVAIAFAKLKADQELQESSRALQQAQQIGRIGSYVYELARNRWTSSPELDSIFGIDAGFDRSAAGWDTIIHPAQRVEILAYLHDISEQHRRFDMEYRIMRVSDGVECWVHDMGEVEFAADGAPVRMVGTMQDITERKRTEEKIYRYTRRLIQMDEDLRKRIAMELHDDVGQQLAALGLNLSFVGDSLSETEGHLRERLTESRKLTKEIGRAVRHLMTDLRPIQMEEYGLAASVRAHAELYANRTGIAVDFEADQQFPRLAAKKEIALFRIIQEALSNVAKHAAATRVAVLLRCDADTVRVAIADDGKGFAGATGPATKGGAGWGLANMRERTELIGGTFRVDSIPGEGTTIAIVVSRREGR